MLPLMGSMVVNYLRHKWERRCLPAMHLMAMEDADDEWQMLSGALARLNRKVRSPPNLDADWQEHGGALPWRSTTSTSLLECVHVHEFASMTNIDEEA